MDFRAIPIETLREYAREASVRTSMRQVAAEAGVGRTTLQNFVQGGTSPHPRVKRALTEWYLRERGRAARDAVTEDFAAALEVLVAELPEEARRQARATLLEILDRVHALVGVPLPAGLAALRERLARG